MKSIAQVFGIIGFAAVMSCGGGSSDQSEKNIVVEVVPETVIEVVDEMSSDPMADKGIGPISSITINQDIDVAMAAKGKELYNQMCSACHKIDVKFIGPSQKGVLDRRSPEWVMNMILNPQEMLEKNATAIALLKEFNNVPMTNMGLTEEQARSVLEYIRTF